MDPVPPDGIARANIGRRGGIAVETCRMTKSEDEKKQGVLAERD
jgi:hypothetical protein